MKVAKNSVVTLRQRVSDPDGAMIDEGATPIRYVHGGYHDIFDRIEQALDGKTVGYIVTVRLEPKDAFGEYNPDLLIEASVDQFERPPRQGDMVERDLGAGTAPYRVTDLRDDAVVLDGNHPLAGMTLDFQAEVLEVRRASGGEVMRVEKAVTAGISRLRALKMAAICLLGVPAALVAVVGILAEWLKTGLLLYLTILFLAAVLLTSLWKGIRYVQDMVRGGEVLRIDVKGLYWRDFGVPVAWEEIAKVEFEGGVGEEVGYSLTLADGRRFKLDASALSIDANQIAWLFANYLPAEKLAGI
jgi:FKBP-type peptidyl-prolyl cis-trans isomerase SlyD